MMRRRVHAEPAPKERARDGVTRRRTSSGSSSTAATFARTVAVAQRASFEEEQPLQGWFTAVQRYTVVKTRQQRPGYWQGVGAPLRVADDGTMAVKHVDGAPKNSPDYQVFFATGEIIASSQQALTAVGSAFTIAQGHETLVGRAPGDRRAPSRTLHRAVTANTDLARIGKGSHTFNVCSANLSNFLGALRGLPGDDTKLERRRDVELKLVGSLDHDRQSVVIGEDLDVAMKEARKIVTGKEENGPARDAYDTLEESMRKQISAQYGIDEGAVTDVGQGFGIIRGGTGGRDGMGHFAPVIAVSGQDRVTLENDVQQTLGREKHAIGEINPNWYFRMFGPVKKHWYGDEDQTFWGEAKKHERGEYGDRPLVATLGSRAFGQAPNGDQ